MAQLQRIILLHTHLPGVVELDVSGHTNICGTNASGKTTLQRLIPVFYGEQPSRVVPKTRDRFDVFYLPHQNSYVIYEYNAADGVKHVVLTKRTDGVDYRFVDSPYQSELYLNTTAKGIEVVSYNEWTQRLRHAGIACSAKISATSEYRAIIQNDLHGLGYQRRSQDRLGSGRQAHGKDRLRLRQLAARYSLVGEGQRLRHIEKLVSAVHAKEGKMDTLKSMLATILEEDGYQRPELRIKPAKIRAWVREMRQFVAIDDLHQQYHVIETCRADIASQQQLLWQLRPLLDADSRNLRSAIADLEALVGELRQQRDGHEQSYQSQRDALHDTKHETQSKYQQLTRDLEHAEAKRNHYLDSDIESLEEGLKSLPLWQQNVEEKGRHLALMLEKNDDIARQLEQRKNQLADNLDRLQRKNHQASEGLRQQQHVIREQQANTLARLHQELMQAQQETQTSLHEQLQSIRSEIAGLQARLEVEPLTQAEREDAQLADARIDVLQDEYQRAQDQYTQAERHLSQTKQHRQDGDHALSQTRAELHRATEELHQLERQLNPEQGSLRAFLREHHPGWQHTLGKVIAEPLLERTDLNPRLASERSHTSLFGVELELSTLEQPPHATDEDTMDQLLHAAKAKVANCEQQLAAAATLLEQQHQQVQLAEQSYQSARQQRRRLQQDLEYARDAKKRLNSELQTLIKTRQQSDRKRLETLQAQVVLVREQHQQRSDALRHDFKALELEHRADFQEQLDKHDDDLTLLQRQIDDMRDSNRAQIKELQAQVHQQLAVEGVDAERLSQLKGEISVLHERITTVKDRQHEWSQYQDFINSVWLSQRPQWLDEQQRAKQQLQATETQLSRLQHVYKEQRAALGDAIKDAQSELEAQRQLATTLAEQLQRCKTLLHDQTANDQTGSDQTGDDPSTHTEANAAHVPEAEFGRVTERVERLTQTLNEYQQDTRRLKEACERFAASLRRNASAEFATLIEREYERLEAETSIAMEAEILGDLFAVLRNQRAQVVDQGRNIGGGLQSFFKVFDDVNRKVGQYSRRLTEVVGDDLALEGIARSEVIISSTVDELGFWQPLQQFSQLYTQWNESGQLMPSEQYLDRLSEVAELLKADQEYSFESLLKLELHLNERGSELIIRNDRQLLESSSHGMAYLILCKFLLAFTRLLRGDSRVIIHWPIDEIGTLAYHNVERLFDACESNDIQVVGAFPNPESDVLLLFKHRYLIEPHRDQPSKGQLKRIQPRVSPLSQRLAAQVQATTEEHA